MDLCFNFHLDHFLQFSLLKKVWVSVQPSTELLLERARKDKRAALLLNPDDSFVGQTKSLVGLSGWLYIGPVRSCPGVV